MRQPNSVQADIDRADKAFQENAALIEDIFARLSDLQNPETQPQAVRKLQNEHDAAIKRRDQLAKRIRDLTSELIEAEHHAATRARAAALREPDAAIQAAEAAVGAAAAAIEAAEVDLAKAEAAVTAAGAAEAREAFDADPTEANADALDTAVQIASRAALYVARAERIIVARKAEHQAALEALEQAKQNRAKAESAFDASLQRFPRHPLNNRHHFPF